jgi:uncharacterized membrane protein
MGGLGELILASVLFVGGHFVASARPVRAPLVTRMGERGFSAVYSLIAIVLLAWMIIAYGRAPVVPLWTPALWMDWLPAIFMVPATLLFVSALTQDNPTAVMQHVREGARPAPGILAVTRHPLMWAIGLWALAHIPPNGTAGDLIFFGGFAVLALAGTLALDAKKRAQWGAAEWRRLADCTSNLPFAAMASGRARLRPGEIGGLRIIGAATLYVLLVYGHPFIAGVPAVAP